MASNNEVDVTVEPSKTATSWWPSSWSSSVKTPSPDTGTNSVGWSNPLNWFSTKSTTPVVGGRYSRKSRRHRRSKKGGKKRKSLRFRQGG